MSDIQQKGIDEVYCSSCGAIIKKEAEICPKCGVRQKPVSASRKKIGWVYFADAVKKYVVFSGRARRAEFWWYCVCVFAIQSFAYLISTYVFGGQWFSNIVSLGLFLPSLTVGWRRMHDVGKPGGFILIPIYNIVLAATAGVPGSNEYGLNPKEE
jgi:uncharacterized membrane protein YhaH (DUF805 family)